MRTITTIGYEGASVDDFVASLKLVRVETLLDIRELPISRKRGFAKTALSEALTKSGVRYVHLRGLGDPKAGREAARSGNHRKFLKIYKAHLATVLAQADLERAIEIASEEFVCLMCYERNELECHRRVVADVISDKMGWTVRHLEVEEGAATHAQASIRTDLSPREGAPACWG